MKERCGANPTARGRRDFATAHDSRAETAAATTRFGTNLGPVDATWYL